MLDPFFNHIKIFVHEPHRSRFKRRIQIQLYHAASDALQFIVNLSSDAVTNRHDHDDRSNTYDNTEHRQNGTSFIAPDIHHGNLYVFPYLCHMFTPLLLP